MAEESWHQTVRMKPMVYKWTAADREVTVLAAGRYKEIDYLILGLGTHPVAYVRIDSLHPWYKKDYDDIPIDVHGGLTFSGMPESVKSGWWVGWDYAHYGDYMPLPGTHLYDNAKRWITEEIKSAMRQIRRAQNGL